MILVVLGPQIHKVNGSNIVEIWDNPSQSLENNLYIDFKGPEHLLGGMKLENEIDTCQSTVKWLVTHSQFFYCLNEPIRHCANWNMYILCIQYILWHFLWGWKLINISTAFRLGAQLWCKAREPVASMTPLRWCPQPEACSDKWARWFLDMNCHLPTMGLPSTWKYQHSDICFSW